MGKNADLQNPLPPFLVDSHAHLELEPLVAERRGSSAKSVHGGSGLRCHGRDRLR